MARTLGTMLTLLIAIPSMLAVSCQNAVATDDVMIADFEGKDYAGWKTEGNAFGDGPARGRLDKGGTPTRYQGKGLANSYHGYEQGTGKLTSPPFKIECKYINFLIGGGGFPGQTGIKLLLDGKPVRTATAQHRKNRLGHEQHYDILFWHRWDVGDLMGKEVVIEIFDKHTGGMGHVLVDHIFQSDKIREPDPPALLERTMLITKNYVNIPTLRRSPDIMPMHMHVDGKFVYLLNMRMAPKNPDLWMSMDARRFKGKKVRFTVEPHALPGKGGLRSLYQSDEIVHAKGL
jgi:fructan beta-fructosidase